MAKWISDPTRRFKERPFYKAEEIDQECETLISRFLIDIYGKIEFPINSDDLVRLIERHVDDFDQYADLISEGAGVEGVTLFHRGKLPTVRISSNLAEDDRRTNRFRTTLAHEFGHVHFHNALFQMKFDTADLLKTRKDDRIICKRDRMIDAPMADWIEWQACYASGAFLMPKSQLGLVLRAFCQEKQAFGPFSDSSSNGGELIETIMGSFGVSREAARYRLIKLNHLIVGPVMPTLFG